MLIGLEGPSPLAFCFDEVVDFYGRWIEDRLDETVPVKEKGHVVGHRPKYRLSQLLGTEKPRTISVKAIQGLFGNRARRMN